MQEPTASHEGCDHHSDNVMLPDCAISRRRARGLASVRWGLIALCALLVARKSGSAAILAPLLLIAVILGTRHWRVWLFSRRAHQASEAPR